MTEASYTAWDDKQYVWPPPDGWYEAPDGKWWPQGYGPPQATQEPSATATAASSTAVDAVDDAVVDAPFDAADQASPAVGMSDATSSVASGVNGWISDGPDLDVSQSTDVDVAKLDEVTSGFGGDAGSSVTEAGSSLTDAGSSVTDSATSLAGGAVDLTETTELALGEAEMTNGVHGVADNALVADAVTDPDVIADAGAVANPDAVTNAVADAGESTVIGGLAEAAPSIDQPEIDNPTTIVGSDSFDASTSAAREAFGTGLMPPMADRPEGAGTGAVEGLDVPGFDGPPARSDLSTSAPAQTPESFEALAAAAPVTSPPPMDHVAEQQAILDAKPKGASKGLLLAIFGVVALLVIGAALFFALGGDADTDTATGETVATGPGSVSEPHPRVTGVVVFYPDAGVEQRWIVEVLEPVRDVSDEFENDGTLMLAATRIRVTNDSGVDGASLEDLRFNLVDGSGAVVVRTDNSCPPGVDDFDYAASVAVEDSVEGTVCWAIPSTDLAELKLGIESSKVQGRVHIQLQ